MIADHHYFKLFAHCIPVRGANRSVICDLQRRKLDFIPNSLFDLLKAHTRDSIGVIKQSYGPESERVILDYFQFLLEKEYVFLCDEEELDRFPDLDLSWAVPNQVENAIIDADENSSLPYASIFQQLEDLGCIAIQVRNFFPQKYAQIITLLDLLRQSSIESVEIITAYSSEFNADRLQDLADQYPRLSSLVLHSAPDEQALVFTHPYLAFSCTRQKVDSSLHCGIIAPRFFSITLDAFLESQQHNSCLNHKISIDCKGQIKNCPSLPRSYGSIHTTPLKTALGDPEFKKYWTFPKDQIKVCQDCEFRYVCTDCRAYVEDPQDAKSKPLKCGYNPYNNEWQEWSEHPMKVKAMQAYGFAPKAAAKIDA